MTTTILSRTGHTPPPLSRYIIYGRRLMRDVGLKNKAVKLLVISVTFYEKQQERIEYRHKKIMSIFV